MWNVGDDDEICDNTNYREKEAKNKRKWIELCKRRDKEENSILNPQKERINKPILYKKQFPDFGNGHIVPASSSLCYIPLAGDGTIAVYQFLKHLKYRKLCMVNSRDDPILHKYPIHLWERSKLGP